MTPEQINILRAMHDGRWRTATDAAIKSGVPVIRAQNALEALAAMENLAADGRLIRERVNGPSLYRNKRGTDS